MGVAAISFASLRSRSILQGEVGGQDQQLLFVDVPVGPTSLTEVK